MKNTCNFLPLTFTSYFCNRRKTAKATEPTQAPVDPVTGEPQPDYTKLMKHLGPQNRNKDVRVQMQDKLTEKKESPISPTMWINHNPRFHMDDQM